MKHPLPLLAQAAVRSAEVRAREGGEGGLVDQQDRDDGVLDLTCAGRREAGSVVVVVVVGGGIGGCEG